MPIARKKGDEIWNRIVDFLNVHKCRSEVVKVDNKGNYSINGKTVYA